MSLLEISNIHFQIGGMSVLNGVDLSVQNDQLVSLIGPNGAGKTALFNSISGVYKPQQGSIRFNGEDILHLRPHHICRLGIARTFQNVNLFNNMVVIDNIMLTRHRFIKGGLLKGGLFWCGGLKEEIRNRRKVEEIIEFLEIEAYRKKIVGNLPYGIQKRVELGRALALEPKLLMLDEPVAGMNNEETEDIIRFIMDIREDMRISILLVEHDMRVVMDISDQIAVLDFGTKIADGPPEEIKQNKKVRAAYIGYQEDRV